jgi:hypothetical protein
MFRKGAPEREAFQAETLAGLMEKKGSCRGSGECIQDPMPFWERQRQSAQGSGNHRDVSCSETAQDRQQFLELERGHRRIRQRGVGSGSAMFALKEPFSRFAYQSACCFSAFTGGGHPPICYGGSGGGVL